MAHRFIVTVLNLWVCVPEEMCIISKKIKQKHFGGFVVDWRGKSVKEGGWERAGPRC